VSPAFAPVTASLRAPTVINPRLSPGGILIADILVDDVGGISGNARMYAYDFTLAFDKNLLTAIAWSVPRIKAGPNFPWATGTIDNTVGTVHLTAHTDNNTASVFPWYAPTINTNNVLPVASITFDVIGRGETALDLNSVVLYDRYMMPILPVNAIDGLFDNRFQGTLAAPIFQNELLMPETGLGEGLFEAEITVDDVSHLWGFQFSITWDPNVITMYDWAPMNPLNRTAPSIIDVGFARLAASSFFGDPNGLTTSTPASIAKLYFYVNQEGWSKLDLFDEVLGTTTGTTLVPEVHDGAVATVNVADLIGRAAWPDVHRFVQSTEPDPINTLHARVAMNMTGEPVMVQVVFSVYDREFGILLGTIKTTPVMLGPLADATVTADFDTNAWGTPGYKVTLMAQAWVDVSGDGMMDFSGHRIKPVNINVLP